VAWESLDITRETTKSDIERDMDEVAKLAATLQKLTTHIAQNWTLLNSAQARAAMETVCLIDELEAEDEQERVRNGGLSDGEIREAALDQATLQNTESSDLADWNAWDLLSGTVQGDVDIAESFNKAPRYFPLADSLPT
jgi:hypothetical protein